MDSCIQLGNEDYTAQVDEPITLSDTLLADHVSQDLSQDQGAEQKWEVMLNESVFVLSQNMSGEHSCEEHDVNSQLSQDRVVEDTNTSQDLPQDDLAEQRKKISRAEIPAGKILVHNAQGSYLMDEMKWPTLTLADKMMLN